MEIGTVVNGLELESCARNRFAVVWRKWQALMWIGRISTNFAQNLGVQHPRLGGQPPPKPAGLATRVT